MQTVIDFVVGLGGWNWFLLALLLFVVETVLPGVHFIWFGAAALAVGALTLSAPSLIAGGLPIGGQLIAFAAISAAVIFGMRRFVTPANTPSDEPLLNIRASQYIGRTVMVATAFRDGRGRVRVGDTEWAAEGPDLAVGARALVVGVNGTVLKVEPA